MCRGSCKDSAFGNVIFTFRNTCVRVFHFNVLTCLKMCLQRNMFCLQDLHEGSGPKSVIVKYNKGLTELYYLVNADIGVGNWHNILLIFTHSPAVFARILKDVVCIK